VARDPSRPWPGQMVGAVFKLYRATLHLQELQREISEYLSSQPHSTALYSDGSGRRYVLKGHLSHEPPEMMPLIIGDCLQNMRVALDHLAWALAELGGKKPPGNTAFPIYIDPDDFHDRTKKGVPTARSGLGKMRTLPKEAQELIEELQPYHGDDPTRHPLWVLNEYSRIDRHRTLSVMYSLSDYTDFKIGRIDAAGNFVEFTNDDVEDLGIVSGAFYDGQELLRFTLKRPLKNVQVRYESPQYIAFGQRYITVGDPLKRLSEIHDHIQHEVFPKFEEFF
jgi:hypothetical protein